MRGDLLNAVVGNIRDGDAGPACGFNVDVVDPDPVAGDDLAPAKLAKELRVDRQVRVEKAIRVGGERQDTGRGPVRDLELGIDLREETSLDVDAWEHLVGDDHLEPRHDAVRRYRIIPQHSGPPVRPVQYRDNN